MGALSPPDTAPSVRAARSGRARARFRGLSEADYRRAVYAVSALVLCEILGTVGFHALENFTWIDSLYEESMLATGQGPAIALVHDSSKIFASVMGFLSLGSTLTTLVFSLGPFVARMWHEARLLAEREARRFEGDFARGVEEVREKLQHTTPRAAEPVLGREPPPR